MAHTLATMMLAVGLLTPGLAAGQSAAPDPAAQAARELLQMTLGPGAPETLMNQFVEVLVESGRPGLQQALNRAPTDADMAAYRRALQRAFNSVFSKDVWTEALAPIVGSSFSVSEISELMAFYRSPLGQKLLLLQQEGAQRGIAAGQELMERKKVELTQALERELRAAFPESVKPPG